VQVVEAMLIGPGQMPVFEQLSATDRVSIARYVDACRTSRIRVGCRWAGSGPSRKGFVAIVIGTGATLLAALWIGRRRADQEATEGPAHP
jgi:hypothetical protein